MSGPGARFSASVAVMNSASDARSNMLAAPQSGERIAGYAMHCPLVHRHGAEALVEVDRAHVPVEDRPLQPAAAALERGARQMTQQRLAQTLPAKLLPHVEIFEIDPGLRQEGREVGEEQREAGDLGAEPRDHDLAARTRTEQLLAQLFFRRLHFVEELLELRQLADQLQDDGHV